MNPRYFFRTVCLVATGCSKRSKKDGARNEIWMEMGVVCYLSRLKPFA